MSSETVEKCDGAEALKETDILVVDDEPLVGEVISTILASHGHNVVLASDGAEAVSLLRQRRFDIVFTDLTMPGISGWDVVTSVKRISRDIPVVVVSGWGAGIDTAEVERRGADGIIHKPFDMKELLDLVARMI